MYGIILRLGNFSRKRAILIGCQNGRHCVHAVLFAADMLAAMSGCHRWCGNVEMLRYKDQFSSQAHVLLAAYNAHCDAHALLRLQC